MYSSASASGVRIPLAAPAFTEKPSRRSTPAPALLDLDGIARVCQSAVGIGDLKHQGIGAGITGRAAIEHRRSVDSLLVALEARIPLRITRESRLGLDRRLSVLRRLSNADARKRMRRAIRFDIGQECDPRLLFGGGHAAEFKWLRL